MTEHIKNVGSSFAIPAIVMAVIVLWSIQSAYAKPSQCAVIQTLHEIDNHIDILNGAESSSALDRLIATPALLIEELQALDDNIYIADDVTGETNWLASFLAIRSKHLIQLRQRGLLRLPSSPANPALLTSSHQLGRLTHIIGCSVGEDTHNGLNSQNTGVQESDTNTSPDYSRSPVTKIASVTQWVAKISRLLSENAITILPVIILALATAAIWGFIKVEEVRADWRQRFQCHIDVAISNDHFAMNGVITDISKIGAGLRLEKPVRVGSLIRLKVDKWHTEALVMRIAGLSAGVKFTKRLKFIPEKFDLVGKKAWVPEKRFRKNSGNSK